MCTMVVLGLSSAGQPRPRLNILGLPPAEPGMSADDIDAPALVLDHDGFHAKLELMANFAAQMGVKARPHAKKHK
jgi:hypothetical protein